jgi:hypothetical protein
VTRTAARQIERARYAALRLMRGDSIADVTHEAGYFASSCRFCTRPSRSPRRSFSSAPWRDLPKDDGRHSTVANRFYCWWRAGILERGVRRA